VALKRPNGRVIGQLSVLDFVEGTALEAQLANLHDSAALAMTQLEQRREGVRTTGEI
jgi:hypothetical protein